MERKGEANYKPGLIETTGAAHTSLEAPVVALENPCYPDQPMSGPVTNIEQEWIEKAHWLVKADGPEKVPDPLHKAEAIKEDTPPDESKPAETEEMPEEAPIEKVKE